jgi:hypothetical protein
MPVLNYPGVNVSVDVTFPVTHQRGMGVGFRTSWANYNGGSNWSIVTRKVIQSKKSFSRCKLIKATFNQGNVAPIVDIELSAKNFQFAIEPIAKLATSGLASSPKMMFTFSGSTTAVYGGPGTNPKGYVESDWLYLDTPISADQSFALWDLTEDNARAPGSLPQDNSGGSSYINRWEGSIVSTTSQMGSLLTLDSITPFTSNQGGGSSSCTPAFILIDYDDADIVVGIEGDSTGQGVGEGNLGSGTTSDVLGTVKGNTGWIARGVNDGLGLNYAVNMAKASDGTKYKALNGAMRLRHSLMRRANPSHIFDGDGINDLSGNGSNRVKIWAVFNAGQNYAYSRGDVVVANGGIYLCVRGGSPATTGTGPSGTDAFVEITNGGNRWVYLLPDTASGRTAATAYAGKLIKYDHFRETVPGVKISCTMVGPLAQSSDGFASVAGQTPNYPPVTGARDLLNGLYRRQPSDPTLGVVAFYDLNKVVEYDDGAGIPTGKWAVASDRTATTGPGYFYTQDGTHQNSNGHATLGAAMPNTLFT